MKTVRLGLLFGCALLSPCRADEPIRADEPTELCVVRTWIADALQLSSEQRRKVEQAVAGYHRDLAANLRRYPRGGQDSEGEYIRKQMQKAIYASRSSAVAAVRELLTEEQRRRWPDFVKLDLPTQEVTLKPGLFVDLLRPHGSEELQLTAVQQSRLRALLLQAEEDFVRPHDDPDRQFQSVRQAVHDGLAAKLTDERQSLWKAVLARPHNEKPALIYGPRLFSSYELNRRPDGAFGGRERVDPGFFAESSLAAWPFVRPPNEDDAQPRRLWHPEDELIHAAARSPDGRWVVSLGSTALGIDKSSVELRLWNARNGKLVQAVRIPGPGHNAAVEFVTSECIRFRAESFGR